MLHSIGALTDFLLPQASTMGIEDELRYSLHGSKQTSFGKDARDADLHETITPTALLGQTRSDSSTLCMHAYMLLFVPVPEDRKYANFALFLQNPLSKDVANISVDLKLARGRIVSCKLVPCGEVSFDDLQVTKSEKFQSVLFSVLLDRELAFPNLTEWSTTYDGWYLLLPLIMTQDFKANQDLHIDWKTIDEVLWNRDLNHSSHMSSVSSSSCGALHFADGLVDVTKVPGSLVKTIYSKTMYCVLEIIPDLNGDSTFPNPAYQSYAHYFKSIHDLEMSHKEQILLKVKPLRYAHNLLVARPSKQTGSRASEEMLLELPPEFFCMKLFGLYDGLINGAALLPSFMHRLESILIANQLRGILCTRFLEGSNVSANKVLEALTTEKCMEQFSLERLELLGDSFLKYAISCHLFLAHDSADEGFLSSQRNDRICNASLCALGKSQGLPGYIRDTFFRPENWIAPFHPSKVICDESNIMDIHGESSESKEEGKFCIVCNKRHRWIQRKTVADVVEALIGAYLIDGGQSAASAFMRSIGFEVTVNHALLSNICSSSENSLCLTTRFNVEAVEKLLSYTFRHKGLLIEAFTHASSNEHVGRCYQRLEFLGDSVLDYLMTRFLYEKFSDLKPGQLTDLRSATVNNENFARVAVQHKLYVHLIQNSVGLCQHINKFVSYICDSSISKTDFSGDWNGDKCPKVLGDLVESLAGAVFLDTGFDLDVVWKVFQPILQPIVTIKSSQLHPVRELQELCQRNHFNLTHLLLSQDSLGSEFQYQIQVKDKVITGVAAAKDKRSAKRQAAHNTLSQLKELGYVHSHKNIKGYLDSVNNKGDPAESFLNMDPFSMKVQEASKKDVIFADSLCPVQINDLSYFPADPKLLDASNSSNGLDTKIKVEQEKDKYHVL